MNFTQLWPTVNVIMDTLEFAMITSATVLLIKKHGLSIIELLGIAFAFMAGVCFVIHEFIGLKLSVVVVPIPFIQIQEPIIDILGRVFLSCVLVGAIIFVVTVLRIDLDEDDMPVYDIGPALTTIVKVIMWIIIALAVIWPLVVTLP